MPKNETFWNPYRMVPVENEVPKRNPPTTHERYQGLTGEIAANLTSLTPLLIGGQRIKPKSHIVNEHTWLPVLPGSSLKGMIRSLAEVVANGCDVTNTSDSIHSKCTDPNNLCICCRMFGMQKDQKSFLGKVSFGEGQWRGEGRPEPMQQQRVLLSNPKERHSAFYPPNKKVRKFYHHNLICKTGPQTNRNQALESMVSYLTPLKAEELFTFNVGFSNLENEEFNLLLYCLALEQNVTVTVNGAELTGNLYHKLGMGKPIGMGSVRIEITKIILNDQEHARRYRTWDRAGQNIIENENLSQEIDLRTAPFRNNNNQTMRCLRSMLFWNPDEKRTFEYPEGGREEGWFTENPLVQLKDPLTGT